MRRTECIREAGADSIRRRAAREDTAKNDWEERAMKSILGALLVTTIVVSAVAAAEPKQPAPMPVLGEQKRPKTGQAFRAAQG